MNDSDNIITIQTLDSSYYTSTINWQDVNLTTSSASNNMSGTVYSTSTIDTISFPNISSIDFTEFEGIMPSIEKVKEMCDEYPALEKAYENFKLIYKLVHDDWILKQENLHG